MPRIYEQSVKKYIPEYMGLVFEQMCRDYLLRYDKKLPVMLSDVGQWWATDPKTRKEVQIDIVGTPAEGDGHIIGSCKYKNEPIGIDELELLKQYASVFGKGSKHHYYIFSKSGFTKGFEECVKEEGITFLTLEGVYRN